MENLTLSICIPTYNHGKYISKLLDSLLPQIASLRGVEIVISDNASEDNTEEICRGYLEIADSLSYSRNAKNLGSEGNYIKLLKSARGKYIWILGSDDWVENGGVRNVYDKIIKHDGICGLTVECNTYSKDERLLNRISGKQHFVRLKGVSNIYAYEKIGYRLGFWSAHIYLREKALSIINAGNIELNLHSVHAVLTELIVKFEDWGFIGTPIVAWRSGNEALLDSRGYYGRYRVDIDAYLHNVNCSFATRKKVKDEFVSNQLICCVRGYVVKSTLAGQDVWKIRLDAFRRFWMVRNFWKKIAPIYIVPRSLLRIVISVRKRLA